MNTGAYAAFLAGMVKYPLAYAPEFLNLKILNTFKIPCIMLTIFLFHANKNEKKITRLELKVPFS